VLKTLEDIIIEFACSDDFEERSNSLHKVPDLMRTFEFKLMAYLEIYPRLAEQKVHVESEDEEEGKSATVDEKPAYVAQSDFLKVVQVKMSTILSKQRAQHLDNQGFVMNHSSTKSLIEFLHAYLNFLTKFLPAIEI